MVFAIFTAQKKRKDKKLFIKQINLSHIDPQDFIYALFKAKEFQNIFCWRSKGSSLISIGIEYHPNEDAYLEDDFYYYSLRKFEQSTLPSQIFVPKIVINYIEGQAHIISQDADNTLISNVINCLESMELHQLPCLTIDATLTKRPTQNLAEWQDSFINAQKLLKEKNVQKIVISRSKNYSHSLKNLSDICLWEPLQKNLLNLDQYFILIKFNEEHYHLSFSPETLVKRTGQNIIIDALAGTRKVSEVPDQNKAIQQELLNNKKELHEHRLVEEFIENVLNELKVSWIKSKTIGIKQLKYVQHLYSQYSAKINQDNWEEIKNLIHPTPAVGARPYQYWTKIPEIESRPRGLYSGLIGWHHKEDEEFCVNLRCLDLTDDTISLHAGCGILPQSEMTHEYIETERKMFNFSQYLNIQNTQDTQNSQDAQPQTVNQKLEDTENI